MRTNLRILAGLTGALLASAAFADCIEGMRDTTPSEAQYHKRVFAALKEVLPAPLPNWTLAPIREPSVDGLCKDAREGEFEITLNASYSYLPPKEEGDRLNAEYRKLQSEIDALRQVPPDIAKERQGWLDKMSVANRASNQAYKEGNKELAKQKDAEAEGYSAQGRGVRNRYLASVEQKLEQLEARQKVLEHRGSAVKVSLVANARYPQSPNPKTATEIVAGKTPTPKSPGLKVHNVRVVLEGSAAKREQIQAGIAKEKLARLVQ